MSWINTTLYGDKATLEPWTRPTLYTMQGKERTATADRDRTG